MNVTKAKVIVVGAGLGGLTLAQGLLRGGFEVAVYERDDADGRPQGISLHMDDRGRSALQANLPPEHAALAEATMGGQREQAVTLADADGALAVVGSRDLDGTSGAHRGRQASRPLLREILLAGLEGSIHFGKEVTGYEQNADGTVTVNFADGGSDSADALVGADGVGSVIRRQYVPDAPVMDTGKRMLMGATPLRAVADTGLPELVGDSPANFKDDGKMLMAMGVLRYAEAPAAARDRLLPSLRSEVVDSAEDYVMYAIPATAELVPDGSTPEEAWAAAKKLADGIHPTAGQVVDNAWPDVTFPHRIGVIPQQPPWEATPVTLIGDAIHLAPGFGGNLAMQDAHRLSDFLADYARGERDLLSAIGSYEEAMRRDSYVTGGER
jgi:2-polyprenyl-6-methoxyphenol hydroxylase-like FAD-dependent oxidoreductase